MINSTGNRLTMEIARQARLADAIADSQTSIATGKRIQSASDDPVAAARVSQIHRAEANANVWNANLDLALSLSAQADSALSDLSNHMARVQELMVAAASGQTSPADRATYALELNGLAAQVDSYMSAQSSLGEPLFSSGDAREMRFGQDVVFAPVPSREDVFGAGAMSLGQIIRDAASAVNAGDIAAMAIAQDNIGAAINRTADAAADIGVRGARMDRMQQAIDNRSIDLAAERSSLEDTDLAEAIARLNGQTITLEAAQAAFARINRQTLFDILR